MQTRNKLLNKCNSKEEIRHEAAKYLHRTDDGDGKETQMASFDKWVEFISNKVLFCFCLFRTNKFYLIQSKRLFKN